MSENSPSKGNTNMFFRFVHMGNQYKKTKLPSSIRQGIKESLVQADKGEFITLDEVKKQ
jgi:hypothetical protein